MIGTRHALGIALALQLGCDGGAVPPPGPAVLPDLPDARPDMARVVDAQVLDMAPAVDMTPPDATPIDMAPRDAAILDATTPDAALPPPTFDALSWQRGSIYLLMVDRFANGVPDPENDPCIAIDGHERFHGGDLVGLRNRLDYLEALGVDTIWVTPLTAQIPQYRESCGYHGYWTDARVPDDGALEPRLGTPDDLHALIAAMHARGMRLILDMVVNHPGYEAPITRSHPHWFHPREGCEQHGTQVEACRLANLPDYDHDVAEVVQYLVAHSLDWATRFAIDGIRMDTVKHVPLPFFRDWWIPAIRAARPELYLVGEVFDGSPYVTQQPYLDAGFDALFDFRLRYALVDGLAKQGDLDQVAQRVQEAWDTLGPQRALLRSTFIENHDVPRYATEITAGSDAEATARYHLALAVLLTTPGVPQLYAGTELGMAGDWPDNRRLMPDWGWDAATRTPHAGYIGHPGETFDLTRDLLRLRRETPALHAGEYAELWRPGGSGVPLYAFHRVEGDSRVIVALHGGAAPLDGHRLPLAANPGISAVDGALYREDPALEELFGRAEGAVARIDGGELVLSLPPRSVTIWRVAR